MRLGLYEKALPDAFSWEERFAAIHELGYSFIEMSVDASSDKLARLEWTGSERRAIFNASRAADIPIHGIVLSAHREFPLGSGDADIAAKGAIIMERAIHLAADLGIRVVQVAGYFSLSHEPLEGTRHRFIDALDRSVSLASQLGVMLAVENVDGRDVTSVSDASDVAREIASPWLAVYADIGNSAANGHSVADLRSATGRLAGVHLKDVQSGVYRRVPFGEGIVDFRSAFRVLSEVGYQGPMLVEMWSDNRPDWRQAALASRQWIERQFVGAEVKREVVPVFETGA